MNMKKCNTCGMEKDFSDFFPEKRNKDGLNRMCKGCCRDYQRNWRRTPKALAHQKLYSKSYQQRPEVKLRNKLGMAKWRKKNPRSLWAQGTIIWHKRGGMTVNISSQELVNLAKTVNACFICGKELRWTQGNGAGKLAGNSPTLDRTDNGTELNLSNIQIICHSCNTTKQNRTMSEFVSYCKMVADKFGKALIP